MRKSCAKRESRPIESRSSRSVHALEREKNEITDRRLRACRRVRKRLDRNGSKLPAQYIDHPDRDIERKPAESAAGSQACESAVRMEHGAGRPQRFAGAFGVPTHH